MNVLAPAKINLFLEITGKRANGYHNLESIFQTIDMYDRIQILPSEFDAKLSLKCNTKSLPLENNLVIKAARELQKAGRCKKGARIYLEKHIPVGAGLGGGSSDAASVLKALVDLWKLKISKQKLHQIASKLGADVPFFLYGGTALAKGIGDKLQSLKNVEPSIYLLIYPRIHVSTASVYRKLRFPLTSRQKITKIRKLLESGNNSTIWGQHLYNRFESIVFGDFPEIQNIKGVLKMYGLNGLMSGSGSSVFAPLSSLKQGEEIREKLGKFSWDVWIVKSC